MPDQSLNQGLHLHMYKHSSANNQALSAKFPRIQPDEIVSQEAALRTRHSQEALRLAACFFHHGFSIETCEAELSAWLARACDLAKMRDVQCRRLAASMMDDALTALSAHYGETVRAITAASLDALARRLPRRQVELAAAAVYRAADPQPPAYMAREAVEDAFATYEIRQARWTKWDADAARDVSDVELAS
jgi:hypothetical protein